MKKQNILEELDGWIVDCLKKYLNTAYQEKVFENKNEIKTVLSNLNFLSRKYQLFKKRALKEISAYCSWNKSAGEEESKNNHNVKSADPLKKKKREYQKLEAEGFELLVTTPGIFIGKTKRGITIAKESKTITEKDLEILRGKLFSIEGRASACYWELVEKMLNDDVEFGCRVRKGAVETAGLNPNISYLHKAQEGKPSLTFDLNDKISLDNPEICIKIVIVIAFLRQIMKILPRLIQSQIEEQLFKGKIIIIYGARQVGKTTLVQQVLEGHEELSRYLNCEILSVQQGLKIHEPERLKSYIGNNRLVVLDEAQKISDIGTTLKILVDTYPGMQIIATGSSSFDLSNKINEPLTGRADKFILYPFSVEEINQSHDRFEIEAKLENLLRFGSYPEVFFLSEDDAKNRLNEIASDYLYQDILSFEKIKKSRLVTDILQLLALQLGNEVSFEELARSLGVSRLTVQKYIDLLEQCFVVFVLRSFSRNLRKEISKSVKIYFYDLGIRNSLVQNYNPFTIRNDVGPLWENFLIIERIKKTSYHHVYTNRYFWRTYDQKEIDYIEERDGRLYAFEFKWNKDKAKLPKEFLETYPDSEYKLINKENYWEFI